MTVQVQQQRMTVLVLPSESPNLRIETRAGTKVLVEATRQSTVLVDSTPVQGPLLPVERAPTVTVTQPRGPIVQIFTRPLAVSVQGGGGGGPAIEYADVSARDSVTPALVYVGFSSAAEGSENPSAAEWKIFRYDSSAPIYTETYASGTTAYDKIWADRELYVYS